MTVCRRLTNLLVQILLSFGYFVLCVSASEFIFRIIYMLTVPGVPDSGPVSLVIFPYFSFAYRSGSVGILTDIYFTLLSYTSYLLVALSGFCTVRVFRGRRAFAIAVVLGLTAIGVLLRGCFAYGDWLPTSILSTSDLDEYGTGRVIASFSFLLLVGALAAILCERSNKHKHGFEVLVGGP
jgi:hypothetical protein